MTRVVIGPTLRRRSPQSCFADSLLPQLMFGKPGSGKGTLSSRLVKSHDIAFVSTGDVLRHEIREKSDVGRKAEKVVAAGGE